MKRWQIWGDNDGTRAEDNNGEWVRFSDVELIIEDIAEYVRSAREGGTMANCVQVFDVIATEIMKRWGTPRA